jgi:DNA-binding beta-propeller fold protein YncE
VSALTASGKVAVGVHAWTPILDNGSIWTPVDDKVQVVDPKSNAVKTIGLPAGAAIESPFAAFGHIWIADTARNVVYKIDPATLTVLKELAVGPNPFTPIEAAGALWLPNRQGGSLSRIDVGDDSVRTIPLPGPATCKGGCVVLAGEGDQIWALRKDTKAIYQVDGDTFEVGPAVAIRGVPQSILVAFGSVWISGVGPENGVTRLLTDDPTHSQTFDLEGASGLVASSDAVWVSATTGVVSQIDPQTNQVVRQEAVGGNAWPVAVASDAIWGVSRPSGALKGPAVWRIPVDPSQAVLRLGTGPTPDTPLVVDGTAWVAQHDSPDLLKVDAR